MGWRYVGDRREFYRGVPMRDLTTEEFAALDEEAQRKVASGLIYEPTLPPMPEVVVSEAVPDDTLVVVPVPARRGRGVS